MTQFRRLTEQKDGYPRLYVFEAYQAAGVTHLSITPAGADRLGLIEKVKNWIS